MFTRIKQAAMVVLASVVFACEASTLPGSSDDAEPGQHLAANGTDMPSGPKKTEPKPLPAPEGLYPRAILRTNGTVVAAVVRRLSQRMGATFFESTDGGVSFTEVGAIDDPANSSGLCCGTLFELPKPLGALPAGTLLWAASRGADASAPMSIPVWQSADGGRKWSFLSTVVTGRVPRKKGGLWEPEFSMTDDGMLVCHWSDETDPNHSQKLMKARSADGVAWKDHSDSVALSSFGARPGMPNVRRPPGGAFVLSYEICGLPNDHCTAFMRTSKDGWDWGDAKWTGNRPTTPDGKHFRHAPTLAWSPKPGGRGRFIMVGQMVHEANGSVSGSSGKIVLANTDGSYGFWYPIAAPVPVPDAYDNYCPNYSSSILPLEDGAVALEIASRWDGKVCRSYFARSPLIDTSDGSEITDGASYRLAAMVSGLCLDSGDNVKQQKCSSSATQRWTVSRATDGTLSLRTGENMCLTAAVKLGASVSSDGASAETAACGGAGQSWKLRAMGVDYYELARADGAACLDVARGSSKAGADVAQWSCNDLSPQLWRFDKL